MITKNITGYFIAVCMAFAQSGQSAPSTAPRSIVNFNHGWQFHFAYDVRKRPETIAVSLPHTWNASSTALHMDYRRQSGIYEKRFTTAPSWPGKRLFLYFEGANTVANVYVNHRFVTEHKGGYTAFCVEITNEIKAEGLNVLDVEVNNAARPDVLPLAGDFNLYGGLHRPVSLIVTEKDCISPLDFASPGVYLSPHLIDATTGEVAVKTKLSVQSTKTLNVHTEITDPEGQTVQSVNTIIKEQEECIQSLRVKDPHLWNGVKDPYLYSVTVELREGEQVLDRVTQPLGFRQFEVNPSTGFSLNNQYLDLHGVGFHEDAAGKGSALDSADLTQDMQLIRTLGATALRLTHYPHNHYLYDLCDRQGLVVWSEIPLVGPGGYTGNGYVHRADLEANGRQLLREMIRQNYNHPSVCFWGLFNELKLDGDDPLPYLQELNQLAHAEDPSRLTTCASFLDNDHFNQVSDLIAWNKYYGWYGGNFEQIGKWADHLHKLYPAKPIAVSEFGAGGSLNRHTTAITQPNPDSRFHPEEWQTLFHEKNWAAMAARPFLWGKFIWALKDFGSSIRSEGESTGINDKGLVSYDGRIKKDAFYFYRANWNAEPMIYLAERRNRSRSQALATVKVFANVGEIKLFVNDRLTAKGRPDRFHTVVWPGIRLQKGNNHIVIKAIYRGLHLEDSTDWNLANAANHATDSSSFKHNK